MNAYFEQRIQSAENWQAQFNKDIHFDPLWLIKHIFDVLDISDENYIVGIDKHGSLYHCAKHSKAGGFTVLVPGEVYEKITKWTIHNDKHAEDKHISSYDNSYKEYNKIMNDIKKANERKITGVLNPPYKDGTHLEYLEHAIKNFDKFVIIEPASFLINEKPDSRNTIEKRLKQALQGIVYRIEIRNPNQIFKNAKLATPIAIIFVDKSKIHDSFILKDYMRNEEWEMSDINRINKYGNNPLYFSIKEKISKFIEKNGSFLDIKNRIGSFYINFSQIRGNVNYNDPNLFDSPDFFTFVPNNLTISKIKEKAFSIGDKTEKESKNRLSYLRLKIPRFCLSIYKIHNNIDRGELAIIPDLDFTKSYTDQDLKKIFGFSHEEWVFIDKNIPEY